MNTAIIEISGMVIEQDGKFLLVQEKNPKVYRQWNLPAGYVDKGETPEEAAVREVKEECGLDVEVDKHLITLNRPEMNRIFHAYLAKNTKGKIEFSKDEVLNVTWFSRAEINDMKNQLRNPEYILSAIEGSDK